jgi:hypothetical protein
LRADVFVGGKQTWNEFVANQDHQIDVTIGPRAKGAIVLEKPLDESLLPPTEDGAHLLTITFFDPGSMDRPQVSTTLLPRTGRTAPCRFTLRVGRGAEAVEARVTVLHENRVIETAVLKGPVVEQADFPSEPPDNPRIRLALVVQIPHADFSERPRFDAAIVLNHLREEPYMTASRGPQSWAVRLGAPQVEELRDRFAELLDRKWHSRRSTACARRKPDPFWRSCPPREHFAHHHCGRLEHGRRRHPQAAGCVVQQERGFHSISLRFCIAGRRRRGLSEAEKALESGKAAASAAT